MAKKKKPAVKIKLPSSCFPAKCRDEEDCKLGDVKSGLDVVNPEPECCRSGNCCRVILLGESPRRLEDDYRRWKNAGTAVASETSFRSLAEAYLFYPMLTGTCRGKWKHPDTGEYRYVYGPCNFFAVDAKKQAICKIHHIKPYMCYAFPYYRAGRQTERAACSMGPNPGYMAGCGYNKDPKDGWHLRDFAKNKLIPLEPEEMEPHSMQVSEKSASLPRKGKQLKAYSAAEMAKWK